MTKLSEVAQLLNKINCIDDLVYVNNLEVQGRIPSTGSKVSVSVENFKLDSGVHNTPVNFSVIIRVNGVYVSRWDMTFEQDQKEFQQGWIRLVSQLQKEEMMKEDSVKSEGIAEWNSIG